MGVRRKKCRGGQKHSRDGHLSENYSQVSASDRVTNLTIRPASADAIRAELFFHVTVHYADINQFMCH